MNTLTRFKLLQIAIQNLLIDDAMVVTGHSSNTEACITHCLAKHIEKQFMQKQTLYVDLDYRLKVEQTGQEHKPAVWVTPDILIHTDRGNPASVLAALVCSKDYITVKQRNMLRKLQKLFPVSLILGISFLPTHEYLLLYRIVDDVIHYYHIRRDTGECQLRRSKELEQLEETQYSLFS